ncbi:ATP-dependent DNA helicase [Daldinia bambusicola]|nr:ATP-dependent DNA helicase [Daldinia bambusicola]
MSDYDSGDDLFQGVDADNMVVGKKRGHSSDDEENHQAKLAKQPKVHGAKRNDTAFLGDMAKSILKEKFGYDDFRHEQFSAIVSILQKENTLVVFPTGAGKSLCYQVEFSLSFLGEDHHEIDAVDGSEARTEPGLSIIVSPLIALMKDQVDALLHKGIAAACLDSTKTYEQQMQINAGIREGQLRLLYCAPERLNNEGFVESMKHVPGGIRLVAVDEAHCISEWGHSFRPDYLKVARFVQEINAERVTCLTATATPRVIDDITKAFEIKKSSVFRTSPYRPNLHLLAECVATKQDKYPKIFRFLREHPGPTLIYVTLQKQAELLAENLGEQGFSAVAFHAGLRTEVKTQIQDSFMADSVPIVVATIAFGMGIDKPNIRNVIHFDLSSTVEEYSQQIGRAGRDGEKSHCMFYICPDDFYLRENFARGDLPSRQSLRRLLEDIFHRKVDHTQEGDVIRLNQITLGRDYDIRASPLSILLATLELRFGLVRSITPEYTSYKFEAMPKYHHTAQTESSVEGKAIYKHAKKPKSGKLYDVDINKIVREMGLLRSDLVRKLQEYNDNGIILLKKSGVENKFKILNELPKTPNQIKVITDKLYVDMEAREEDALRRTQQVADLITGDKCFALALAEHFGMGLPGDKVKCGHCSYCLTGKRVILPARRTPAVDIAGIKEVLKECNVRDDPRFLARVAFGIKSPRVMQLKLYQKTIFMSLADHDFKVCCPIRPII